MGRVVSAEPTVASFDRGRARGVAAAAWLTAAALLLSGCSIRRLAVNSLGAALAQGSATWASDDDPELVRDALPFALKTTESLLASSPDNRDLLLAAASGYTQYSYAFVQSEADYVEATDLARATALRVRAGRLYRRAQGYGLRGLEVEHPSLVAAMRSDPTLALAPYRAADVPLLYWTAASWAARIALAKDDPELSADLALTAALMARARELDPGFGGGAIADFFIAYEGGRPASAGGSIERANQALADALRYAAGRRASPLVAYAETVCVGRQDRAEFTRLLQQALAIDADASADNRLANLLAQRRARWLLERVDELFVE